MRRFTLALAFVLSASVATSCWAVTDNGPDDWPQFRGPTGDGVSGARGLPINWSETQDIAWKVPIAAAKPNERSPPKHHRRSPIACPWQ